MAFLSIRERDEASVPCNYLKVSRFVLTEGKALRLRVNVKSTLEMRLTLLMTHEETTREICNTNSFYLAANCEFFFFKGK